MEHKYAIFVLGTEIANAMKEVDYTSSSRISARMKELADKTLKEMDCSINFPAFFHLTPKHLLTIVQVQCANQFFFKEI